MAVAQPMPVPAAVALPDLVAVAVLLVVPERGSVGDAEEDAESVGKMLPVAEAVSVSVAVAERTAVEEPDAVAEEEPKPVPVADAVPVAVADGGGKARSAGARRPVTVRAMQE